MLKQVDVHAEVVSQLFGKEFVVELRACVHPPAAVLLVVEVDRALGIAANQERPVHLTVGQREPDCFHNPVDLLDLKIMVQWACALPFEEIVGLPVRRDVEEVFEGQPHGRIRGRCAVALFGLFAAGRFRAGHPLAAEELLGRDSLENTPVARGHLLHLFIGESLLHAQTDEVLRLRRDALENPSETEEGACQLYVEARVRYVHRLQSMDQAALIRVLRQFDDVFLRDNIEPSGGTDRQHDTQVKQIEFFQLLDAQRLLLVSLVFYQGRELVPQQSLSVSEVLGALRHQLHDGEVLVQCAGRLTFAFYYMTEPRAKTDFAAAVEHDLAAADCRVREALPVNAVDSAQHLLGELLQDALWQCTD